MISKATSPRARQSPLARFARKILSDGAEDRDALLPLYRAVVAAGRDPFWYRDAGVPDSLQGRFDMIAAILAIVLIRFEAEEGEDAKRQSALLTELFVADMDESLHQVGIGDYAVGKHIGRMMSALGGRLGAFRRASQDRDFEPAVGRNIYHEDPPSEELVGRVAARLERLDAGLLATPLTDLLAGKLPPL